MQAYLDANLRSPPLFWILEKSVTFMSHTYTSLILLLQNFKYKKTLMINVYLFIISNDIKNIFFLHVEKIPFN